MSSVIRVVGVFVTPVKSFASQSVRQASLDPYGLVGDRRFMVVDKATGVFLSQRDIPAMATISADWPKGEMGSGKLYLGTQIDEQIVVPVMRAAEERLVVVQGASVRAYDQGDFVAEWLSNRLGRACRLVHMSDSHSRFALTNGRAPVAYVDDAPLLMISEASLEALNKRLQAIGHPPVDMSRFRATIVVAGCEAFAEDTWRQIAIQDGAGSCVVLEWIKRCKRCKMTTVDQVEGRVIDKEPLATLAKMAECKGPGGVYFGSYYRHTTLGRVANNDRVVVVE